MTESNGQMIMDRERDTCRQTNTQACNRSRLRAYVRLVSTAAKENGIKSEEYKSTITGGYWGAAPISGARCTRGAGFLSCVSHET